MEINPIESIYQRLMDIYFFLIHLINLELVRLLESSDRSEFHLQKVLFNFEVIS